MNNALLSGVIALSVLSTAPAAASQIRTVREPVKDQYIVVFRDDVVGREAVLSAAHETALRHGGRVLNVYKHGLRGYAIEIPEQRAVRLTDDHRVAWVEQNALVHFSYDVEQYADDSRWHLDRIDQRTPIPQHFQKAYGWTSRGNNVDVYVVDSGIQAAHTEFNGNVAYGANYAITDYDSSAPNNPCGGFLNNYDAGHGTAVASLIGGRTVGVARSATLIPVKVASCRQEPRTIEQNSANVVASLDWILARMAANPGRRAVVNISSYMEANMDCVDAQGNRFDCRPALEHNIRNLLNGPGAPAYGAVVVTSANNQNANRCSEQSPARFSYGGMYDPGNQPSWPYVITVGGTNIDDQRHNSNFGPSVNIYAPGHRVRSAHPAAAGAYRDEQLWATDFTNCCLAFGQTLTAEQASTGTSFSAPIVSGIAARLLETFPSLSVRQVWDHIRDTATPLPAGFDGDTNPANDRLAYISVYQ